MEKIEEKILIKEEQRSGNWLKRILSAALVALVTQAMFIYLKEGNLLAAMGINEIIEYGFTFIYFLSLFWMFPKISIFIHSDILGSLRSVYLNIIESVTVVFTTFFLTLITKFLPLWVVIYIVSFISNENWIFDPIAVKRSLIVHALLGLFLYYFFERQRIYRRIREEQLRYAQLQREEFKSKLDILKNNVNPEFLFGNLELLESLIKKDPIKAREFVGRLSFLYRSFLENRDELIPLKKELEVAKAYFEIIKAGSSEEVNLKLYIPEQCKEHQLPPGTLQLIFDFIINNTEVPKVEINMEVANQSIIINSAALNKETSEASELKQIQKKYSFFTDQSIEFLFLEEEFQVRLPLFQLENYRDK